MHSTFATHTDPSDLIFLLLHNTHKVNTVPSISTLVKRWKLRDMYYYNPVSFCQSREQHGAVFPCIYSNTEEYQTTHGSGIPGKKKKQKKPP